MKTLMLFSLFLLAPCVCGNKIQIEIDSDDLLKILNGFVASNAFRNVAGQIVHRSNFQRGVYNNPYHPEDDAVIDDIGLNIQERRKMFKKTITTETHTPLNEAKLERDNENYILNTNGPSEDELDNNEKPETVPTTTVNTPYYIKKKELQTEKSKFTSLFEKQNYKMVQKRFVLKNA